MLLVSSAIIVVLLLALAGLMWFIKRRRAQGAGTCGKCGYNVTGLPTFICPECGSDLRDVGINQGGGSGAGSLKPSRTAMVLGLELTVWTLLYGALYGFIGARSYPSNPVSAAGRKLEYGLVDAYLWPYEGKSTHSVTLTPSSGGYRAMTVTEHREALFKGWRHAPIVNWSGNGPSAGLSEFTLTLDFEPADSPVPRPAKPTQFHVDPATLAWHFENPATDPPTPMSGTAPVTGQNIYGWMLCNGIDLPSPVVRQEADALADLITTSARAGVVTGPVYATGRLEAIAANQRGSPAYAAEGFPFTQMRGTAQDSYGPGWSIYWLSIPFGLGLYTYGTNWIWARHRKRRKRRKSAPGDAAAGSSAGGSAGYAAPAAAAAAASTGNGATPPSALSGLAGSNGPALDPQRSRTLTILFTDLQDYTAKTSANSRADLLAMLKVNQTIVEPAVMNNRGTVIKTIGDAYLVTFESATDAVKAGLEIQAGALKHNEAAQPNARLDYRVAVCTGEVVLLGGDVFGTAVNMAARVQAVTEPGEVYFTESTFHAINMPDIPHEELGSKELKGIPNPVRLYRANHPE